MTRSQRASKGRAAESSDAELEAFVRRGRECAFANVRMLGRIVGAYYDEVLKPAGLRASQLALLWAIVASEPVDHRTLGRITMTDPTTLSRTVDHLRDAGLVLIEAGEDRRTRFVRLSQRGRRAFARAMPYWERAQRDLGAVLSLAELQALAKGARRLARTPRATA
jgi:DNA-binding MarR family transcriptional regulator